MKRVEQKEERRENILKAALNLFIEKGYAATRTIRRRRSRAHPLPSNNSCEAKF